MLPRTVREKAEPCVVQTINSGVLEKNTSVQEEGQHRSTERELGVVPDKELTYGVQWWRHYKQNRDVSQEVLSDRQRSVHSESMWTRD